MPLLVLLGIIVKQPAAARHPHQHHRHGHCHHHKAPSPVGKIRFGNMMRLRGIILGVAVDERKKQLLRYG